MGDEAKAFFSNNRLLWKLSVGPEFWTRTFATSDPDEVLAKAKRELAPLLRHEAGEWASWRFEGDHLEMDFLCPAAWNRTRRGALAFANSGISHLQALKEEEDITGYRLRTEDDGDFPLEFLEEAMARSEDVVVPVRWQPGDVLCVDNRTVMHGRRAFDDPERNVMIRIGYKAEQEWGWT